MIDDQRNTVAHVRHLLDWGVSLGWDWLRPHTTEFGGISRWRRLEMELEELKQAIDAGEPGKIADEIGDVAIVLVSLAIVHGVDPDIAIRAAVMKVSNRLLYIERRIGPGPHGLDTLRDLWKQAKGVEVKP